MDLPRHASTPRAAAAPDDVDSLLPSPCWRRRRAARTNAAALLGPREVEILTLVSKGLTNPEIADVVSLSRLTVGCHIKNIYKKLAVNSRTQAVFEARSHGLLY